MADRFVPRRQGYIEVMNGDELYDHCDKIGANWADRLGDGYTHDTIHGKRRIHTRVKTSGAHGFFHEMKHHTLATTFPGKRKRLF